MSIPRLIVPLRLVGFVAVALLAPLLTRPATAQAAPAQCEPWVSHVFNAAVGDRVAARRPTGTRAPATSTAAAPVAATDAAAPSPAGEAAKPAGAGATTEAAQPCGTPDTAFEPVNILTTDDATVRESKNRALRARLNEIVIVRVQHLQTLWDRANCIDRAATDAAAAKAKTTAPIVPVKDCRTREIRLFVDGREIEGLKPESGSPDVQNTSGTLRYHLTRTPASKEHWADMLGLDLQERSSYFERLVPVSVGLAGGEPIPTAITAFRLIRIRGMWLAVWVLLAVIGLVLVAKWAKRTDLLRDRSPVVERGHRRPFSLAHCQAAFWTVLTLFALVFIWLVTGERDFSGSALTLLGITAGTVVGARIIDATRDATAAADATDPGRQAAVQVALDGKKQLEKALADAEKQAAANPANPAAQVTLEDARQRYSEYIVELRRTHPGLVAPRSEGLFVDVLSDSHGVSFHRFQMLAWTAILGLMFAIEVLARLGMPEFETNLLALMGISSGTYLGLKIPEQ